MEMQSLEQLAQDKRLLLFSPLGSKSEVQSLLEWKTGLFRWVRHLTIWDVQSQGHVFKSIQDFPVEAMRLFVTWTRAYLTSLCVIHRSSQLVMSGYKEGKWHQGVIAYEAEEWLAGNPHLREEPDSSHEERGVGFTGTLVKSFFKDPSSVQLHST